MNMMNMSIIMITTTMNITMTTTTIMSIITDMNTIITTMTMFIMRTRAKRRNTE